MYNKVKSYKHFDFEFFSYASFRIFFVFRYKIENK